jgi:cephalosporin-C deacetylase-like acetyl esterase
MLRASHAFSLIVILMLGSTTSHSPVQSQNEERSREFYQFLKERGAAIDRQTLSNIRDLSQWNSERGQLRQRLQYMLGLDPLPLRTALHATITNVIERPDIRIENVILQSRPGLYVTGNFYLPKKGKRPFPTVLYLSGHSPHPLGAKFYYQHHALWFAEHGYACLVLDTLEFGEVPGIHHGLYDQNMLYWLSLGYTPAGVEVWNAIRALDYLETRQEVDRKKIALTGRSGGGAMTWYTAALDERVAVAVPVHGTYTVGSQIALNAVEENCDCIFYTNIYQEDFTSVGALIAPRPLKILNAQKDVAFPPMGYNATYDKVKSVYGLYGATDKIEAYDESIGHEDTVSFRAQAAMWIAKWLKNESISFSETGLEREPAEALRCFTATPADAVNSSIHNSFIPTAHPQRWASAEAWSARRAQLLKEMKSQVFRAFPETRVPLAAVSKPINHSWINRYADTFDVAFTSELGLRVRGFLLRAKAAGEHPTLIYVKGLNDSVSWVPFDELLPLLGRYNVFIFNPRATDFPISHARWVTLERTAALLGATIESMQVWDVMRAVEYLVAERVVAPDSISLYGKGAMGIVALYAAILDGRPGRVILDQPPVTHWNGAPLLNILRLTDIPEAAALLAPRELVCLRPRSRDFEYTEAIYRMLGQQPELRDAGSLAQAVNVETPH